MNVEIRNDRSQSHEMMKFETRNDTYWVLKSSESCAEELDIPLREG